MADFDFFDPDFQENTQRHFRRMQEECPFAHTDNPFDWYAVTREADVAALLKDWALWTSNSGPGLGGVLVSVDPPEHRFDRRLINKAFSPASLLTMEDEITELVQGLIDRFVEQGDGDLMALFAVPVPLIVIARLLGLDEQRVTEMRPLADPVIHPNTPPGKLEHPIEDSPQTRYFREMIDERRQMVDPALERLSRHGSHYHVGTRVLKTDGQSAVLQPVTGGEAWSINSDLAVFISLNRPRTYLIDALAALNRPRTRIGDANAPRFLVRAVAEANAAALNLGNRSPSAVLLIPAKPLVHSQVGRDVIHANHLVQVLMEVIDAALLIG